MASPASDSRFEIAPQARDSETESESKSAIVDPNPNREEPSPSAVERNQPALVPVLGSVGFLILVIRLGPISVILVCLLAGLLSALPEFRAIIDAALGIEQPSRLRLARSLPSLVHLNNPNHFPQAIPISESNPISQTILPPNLQASFGALFDLLIRDFVQNWYLLPQVSTGDKAFLIHIRHALDNVLINAYQKISSKSSKETTVYLIGCLSMNLVRRINEPALPNPPPLHQKQEQRKIQTRSISNEILLTLAPPSLTLSPLTLSLLIEIVSVQLIRFTDSFDDHWFCQTIINALGTPPQVSPEAAHEIEQSVEQIVNQDQPPIPASTNPPHHAPPSEFQSDSNSNYNSNYNSNSNCNSISNFEEQSGNQILSHYLKTLHRAPPPAPAPQPQLLTHWFTHTPRWSPSHTPSDSELATLLAQPAPDAEHATLVKIAIQLNSFGKMAQTAGLAPDMLKSDAVALLSALATPMAVAMDAIQARQSDPRRRDYLASGWRAVAVETLRRLDTDVVHPSVFGNMQEWIVERLRPAQPAPKPGQQSPPLPDSRISYMTIPTIPGPPVDKHSSLPPQAHTPDDGRAEDPWGRSPARYSGAESHDLGSIGTEDRWTKATSAATDAVLARHRTPSFTGRTSASPGGSDWGASPRRSSSESHSFSSPQQMGRAQTGRLPYEVPEEGDMAEGYSLEPDDNDAGWSGDMGATMLEQAPAGRRSVSSGSSPDEHPAEGRTPRALDPALAGGPSKPLFSVTLTDMSPRTISDPKTGLLKQKRDLELLVAVESSQPDVPSFIVTRKWQEFEKLDAELGKLKLVGLGTSQFPRALLPSGFLGVKNVEQVLREGEGYLMNLLNEDRYARSGPVLKFFAKERSGMSNARTNTIGTMILGSTSSTLDVIGKGVASVGKEVVSKPADLAAGFNRFSKGVFAGLPFGSGAGANAPSTTAAAGAVTGAAAGAVTGPTTGAVTGAAAGVREEIGVERAVVEEGKRRVAVASDRRASTLPAAQVAAPVQAVLDAPAAAVRKEDAGPAGGGEAGAGVEEAGRRTAAGRANTGPASASAPASSPAPGRAAKNAVPASDSVPRASSKAAGGGGVGSELSGAEFDAVIVGLMAVLEAAYGLESGAGVGGGSGWSVKRGVLRVVETVLRTTSVGGAVRRAVGEWAGKMEVVETYVEQVDRVRESLWPGGKWAGGSSSSSSHSDEQEQPVVVVEVKEEEKVKERELARKLFVESWASLKIGLGSHDTEVAAQKVFERFISSSSSSSRDDGGGGGGDGHGCSDIVHGVVMDLIRIVLLL